MFIHILHNNQFCKTYMSNLLLFKLALFALHDGICGSFHNKARINASALHCVLYTAQTQNLDEDILTCFTKMIAVWAAIPEKTHMNDQVVCGSWKSYKNNM